MKNIKSIEKCINSTSSFTSLLVSCPMISSKGQASIFFFSFLGIFYVTFVSGMALLFIFKLIHFIFLSFFFFLMQTILKVLHWICYNIDSVLCFGLLAVRHVGSQLPDQGSNPYPLHQKMKSSSLGSPGILSILE